LIASPLTDILNFPVTLGVTVNDDTTVYVVCTSKVLEGDVHPRAKVAGAHSIPPKYVRVFPVAGTALDTGLPWILATNIGIAPVSTPPPERSLVKLMEGV